MCHYRIIYNIYFFCFSFFLFFVHRIREHHQTQSPKKKRVSPAIAPATAAQGALPAPMSLDEENDPQAHPQNDSKAATLLNDIDALLSSDDESEEF